MHKIDVIYTLKHVLSARTEKNHRIQGAFFVSQKLNFAMKHSRVNKLQKGRIYRYTLKAANQNKLQKKKMNIMITRLLSNFGIVGILGVVSICLSLVLGALKYPF